MGTWSHDPATADSRCRATGVAWIHLPPEPGKRVVDARNHRDDGRHPRRNGQRHRVQRSGKRSDEADRTTPRAPPWPSSRTSTLRA